MDQSDIDTPPAGRRRLLALLALLAVAGSLVALGSLRAGGPAAPGVDLAAQEGDNPLPAAVVAATPDLTGGSQGTPGGGAAAPAAANPTAARTVSVMIMNYQYSPAAVTIAPGDTVVWTNHDSAPHNVVVTSGPERFTSPTLQTGQTYKFTFTTAGTYSYYCSLHPDMKASVTVTGGSEPPPPPPPGTQPPPPPPGSGGDCVSEQALSAFMAHVKSAHLERSLFDQVNDALAVDQYVLTHTVWLETVLQPVFDGTADQPVKDTLAPVMAHIKAAHLERSPLQQVTDILAVDQYVLTHTVWLETVLAPLAEQLTC